MKIFKSLVILSILTQIVSCIKNKNENTNQNQDGFVLTGEIENHEDLYLKI
jgi:hypothetical protein